MPPGPNVAITYCRLCNWLLRAGWMGQELLSTFAEELGSVTLIPDDTGGVFEVRLDGKLIWSRKEHGRFPEIKELKQLVRDEVAPERDLGHVDHVVDADLLGRDVDAAVAIHGEVAQRVGVGRARRPCDEDRDTSEEDEHTPHRAVSRRSSSA